MRNLVSLPSIEQTYQLKGLIGHGPNASVYSALDLNGRSVALKLYDPRVERDVQFVAHFRRDARRAQSLENAHVLRTYDYGYDDEHYFVVTEYVSGGDIQRYRAVTDPGALTDALLAIADSCMGLAYVHERGMVHRNIKPTNILLRDSGEGMLADLGPTHQVSASGLTVTSVASEAIAYASPEQITGARVTAASDVYSMGVVLYETCTGETPFAGGSPVAIAMRQLDEQPPAPSMVNPHVIPAIEDVILRCLRKDAGDRYADGGELLAALQAAITSAVQMTSLLDLRGSRSELAGLPHPSLIARLAAGVRLAWARVGKSVRPR